MSGHSHHYQTNWGRDALSRVIFASILIYAGLVFLVVTALVLTPVFHYVLHRFHWEMGHSE